MSATSFALDRLQSIATSSRRKVAKLTIVVFVKSSESIGKTSCLDLLCVCQSEGVLPEVIHDTGSTAGFQDQAAKE
jgi:hypothetical protein